MKPGDVVVLSDGLFGLKEPQNLGVVLDVYREKKTRMVRLLTVKGKMAAAQKNVKRVLGTAGEDTGDESVLMAALKKRIDEGGKKGRGGGGAKGPGGKGGGPSPQQVGQNLNVRELWARALEKASGDGSGTAGRVPEWYEPRGFTGAEVLKLAFGDFPHTGEHVAAAEKAAVEKEGSDGYFFRREAGGEVRLHPLKEEVAKAALTEANSIRELRGQYVRKVEDEEGFVSTVPLSKDLSGIELPDHLGEVRGSCVGRMRHFVIHDRWSGELGFAGTGLHRLGQEDLGKIMGDFARDLAGDDRLDISSACLEALISLGEVTWEEAGGLLVTRAIATGQRRFFESFPEPVLMESGRLPDEVTQDDMKGRRDLRDLETYTIDPPDARDFDDAVSIEKGDDGTVTLWVHIADVSHYVASTSHLDGEARRRTTSVYLPTGVLPMLPPKLSEDLCSLREGTPRLAMTVRMKFDGPDVVESELMESVIRVDGNLSYDTALGYFDEGREPFSSMAALADTIREARGRPDIESAERRVRYGDGGNSVDAAIKRATRATGMIETFMVAANEAAARYLRDNEVPGVYRIHPLPARADIERFNAAVQALGMDCPIVIDYDALDRLDVDGDGTPDGSSGEAAAKSRKGRQEEAARAGEDAILEMLKSGGKFSLIPGVGGGRDDEDDDKETPADDGGGQDGGDGGAKDGGRPGGLKPTPVPLEPEKIEAYSSAYAKALEVINAGDDRVFRDVMNLLVLRTMPRAIYSTGNIGHFGLKSLCYTHFTSPIRRYPDVLVHRAVRALLRGGDPPHTEDELDELVETCNEQAESAESFERDMTDAALAIWLSREGGAKDELKTGVVSGLSPSAMFVTLDKGVEGRIPLSKLTDSEDRPVLDDSETSVVLSTLENPKLVEGRLKDMREAADGNMELVLFTLGQRTGVDIHRIYIASGRVELSLLRAGADDGD